MVKSPQIHSPSGNRRSRVALIPQRVFSEQLIFLIRREDNRFAIQIGAIQMLAGNDGRTKIVSADSFFQMQFTAGKI